jgi:UDP-2,3-diacylglucosamine pyrophosphatase LpxH
VAAKTIAISDTHFGDDSMLLDDERLVDRFVEILAGKGEVAELILLGDILDLWIKTPVPALRKAHYFIDAISRLDNVQKIVYVPGNHDHQMFMDAFRLEMDMLVMQGTLITPRFMPARIYDETVIGGLAHPSAKVHFSMTYPFLARKISGREIVFTHGHHLDFYASSRGWVRNFWLVRHIMRKRKKKATLHDVEMANIPFCGAMSVVPWVPELVNEELRFYHVLRFFGRLFRSKSLQQSPLRDSLIKENYEEISLLLPQLDYPDPDCFIYGHTHQPGIGRLPGSGAVVANAGSWTRIEDKEVPARTWVEADGDGSIRLFRLGRSGEELLDEVSLESKGESDGLPQPG